MKEGSEGYWDRRLIKILDNVQLSIENLHIRYEGGVWLKDHQFSFGITLKELTIKTTNDNWEVTFFDRLTKENKGKPLHKMLLIEGFGVYIDTKDGDMHVKQYEGEKDSDFI